MAGQDVYVIGAGNSAGQAAIHLSKYAASVTMVVRGPGLTASMSSYLVTEISKTANIRVRPSTEVTGGHGQCTLERLTLRQRTSGATETVSAAGDVRHRSVKRVASAVGEGATAIQLVHEHLRAEQD